MDFTKVTKQFFSYFNEEAIASLGKETGFIKRKGRLTAYDFIILMVFGQIGNLHTSLAAMVNLIESKISREALHKRFSKTSVRFLKGCLELAMRTKMQKCELISNEFQGFQAIKIVDSSSWDIHNNLKRIFAGSGGSASKANCKLQTFFDYKHSRLKSFKITRGTLPDQKYSASLSNLVNKDELLIFDRGYLRTQTFHDILKKGAYFLTRLISSVTFFDMNDNAFDLTLVLLKKTQ